MKQSEMKTSTHDATASQFISNRKSEGRLAKHVRFETRPDEDGNPGGVGTGQLLEPSASAHNSVID